MNKNNISIFDYEGIDFESVLKLLQEISSYEPDDKIKIKQKFCNNDNSYSIVAKKGEQIIGFGSVFIFERIRGGKCALLEDIIVDKSFRNLKVGSLIVNTLVEYAISKKCFKVVLETSSKSFSFYEKLKFKKNGISMRRLLF